MKSTSQFAQFVRVHESWKLLVAMIVYGVGQGILRPMNAIYLKDQIHLSKLEITLLVSSALIVDMVVTFGIGVISDKIKNKRILPLIAAVLCICGLIFYMRADSFRTALFSMILATSPGGIIMGQLFAMARNHYTTEASQITEMAMVWLRAVYSFGFFLGLLLGAEIFTLVSFDGVLLGNLVSYAILFVAVLVYKERTEQAPPVPANQVMFEWIVIASFLALLCGDAIRGLYFPLLVDSLFHSPALVSKLWSLQAIFELLWMTVAGYLAAKYGSLRVIGAGAVLGFSVYLVYALKPTLWLLILAQPVHSFYVSTLYSIAMGHVQRMFLHRTGFGSSLFLVLTQLSSLIGYFLPNLVRGFSPAIFYLPAGCVILSLSLLCMRKLSHSRHSMAVSVS